MFTNNVDSVATSHLDGNTGAQRAMKEKEQFLALLVAQISHQDPMNPVDDKDMVSQLAQFSAIEQAIETNSRLDSLAQSQATSSRIGLASLIGREGTASLGGTEVPTSGTPTPIAFELKGGAEHVSVRILDGEHNLLRTIDVGGLPAGMHSISWDGMGANHQAINPGRYSTKVEATDTKGGQVPMGDRIRGTIGRIDVDSTEPAVFIGNARVLLADLTEVAQ